MKSQRFHGRQEPRRIGNAAIIAAMIVSLCILTIVKFRYCSAPYAGDAEGTRPMELEVVPAEDGRRTLIVDRGEDEGVEDDEDSVGGGGASSDTAVKPTANGKPTCFESSRRSITCEAAGDVRVDGASQTIFVKGIDQEWKVKPYARTHDPPALEHVKEWTLKPFYAGRPPPRCGKNHSVPALLFSNGGFTGNLYHDYTDVLVPLFATTYHFGGEVQFLVSGLKSWWVNKFILILRQLTNYDILDVENDGEVHCYSKITVGLTFHKDMGIDPAKTPAGSSIVDFKKMLRNAFGLERAAASGATAGRRPRLLIITRKNSRRFLNEAEMEEVGEAAGFEVKRVEPDMNTDMATFAQLVNSADVMIGVHGAGLTNMVFLPRGAVLIQVVPFGGLEWLTRVTFKDPSEDMEITYMAYEVKLDESSLIDQYPADHPVLKDPYAIHKQGWDTLKTVYLDKQNVRLNPDRLKATLLEALRRLPPPS